LGDPGIRGELGQALVPGQTLLLAGIESHICVMQTALGALEAGYNVHVAADATGSRTTANASIGIERMREAGAVISSTEMAIYELLGDSRRPEFKQMLAYLK
jgi:isochorismate hydrolase